MSCRKAWDCLIAIMKHMNHGKFRRSGTEMLLEYSVFDRLTPWLIDFWPFSDLCLLFWNNHVPIRKRGRLKRGRDSRVTSQLGQFGSIRLRCRECRFKVPRDFCIRICARRERVWCVFRKTAERKKGLAGVGRRCSNDMVSNLSYKYFVMTKKSA